MNSFFKKYLYIVVLVLCFFALFGYVVSPRSVNASRVAPKGLLMRSSTDENSVKKFCKTYKECINLCQLKEWKQSAMNYILTLTNNRDRIQVFGKLYNNAKRFQKQTSETQFLNPALQELSNQSNSCDKSDLQGWFNGRRVDFFDKSGAHVSLAFYPFVNNGEISSFAKLELRGLNCQLLAAI